MTNDNSTMTRVMADGGGAGVSDDHRHFADGDVVDGKWRVLAIAGKGGNGEVYRVQNIKTGLLGALKVPNLRDAHWCDRFDRELDVLQHIATWQSPAASRHLPHFIDRGTVEATSVPYFVMEYLPHKVSAKRSAVKKLILAASEAVGELHKNGYLHRDINLKNLMQRDNGDVVLIDFGLVGRIEELDDPFGERISMTQGRLAGVGTEGSAAPEQLFGHASVKSDVYGLGTLANECFGGKPPRRWIPIIKKAQEPQPEYRFKDVNEFISAVRCEASGIRCRKLVGIFLTVLSVVSVCILAFKMGLIGLKQQKFDNEDVFGERSTSEDQIKKAVSIFNSLNNMSTNDDSVWKSFSGSYFCRVDDSHRQRLHRAEESDPICAAKMRDILNNMLEIDKKGVANNRQIQDLHDAVKDSSGNQRKGTEGYNKAELLSMENEKLVRAWLSLLERFTVIEDAIKQHNHNQITGSSREDRPRTFSKLKFIEAMRKRELWVALRKWLEETGQYEPFQAAQNLKEDYPAFVEISKAAKEHFGISDSEFNTILSESVDDQ